MSERNGYIPGVPCWIDTNQPDPDAAAAFYGALFGWDLEDAMPAGSPGKYLIARIRGGDVGAVSSIPEGAVVGVWQAKTHLGARVVNEHGALVFNGLATRDTKAAEKFYGAVFGWKLLTLPAGQMWALPGYGDHLEESTPGLRKQAEEMGAPDGFIDVVAAIDPIPGGDSGTPAHWSVTFAVDDGAAAAAN